MSERTAAALAALLLLTQACELAPPYRPPPVAVPSAYKENASAGTGEGAAVELRSAPEWKPAAPRDAATRGKWWEMFHEPELDALEERLNVANQSIAASLASFEQARALVNEARAQYFPTLTASPAVTRQRVFIDASSSALTYNAFTLPFDASWAPDLWTRVRNTVRSSAAAAQASAADVENTRLTLQAELAVDYYALRAQDSLIELLAGTVDAYRAALDFVRAQFETGVGTDEAVAQAEVQLESAEVQATSLRLARAQYEHAIAVLVGQPASAFSLPPLPLAAAPPPVIPSRVPGELLERRPDIAAEERLVAQANAQIGIARAAYFPTLTLSASAGFESSALAQWLKWPSRVWAVGPTLAETLFDAGLRRATVAQYRAAYEQTVANYRQTVLGAFQQVEDNLAALRILSTEVTQQDEAVRSSRRNLTIATDRYTLGLDPYLNVTSAQSALLGNQQSAVNLRLQQLTASVQLIEALGGEWGAEPPPPGAGANPGS
ncbi:MAG TPA: efflux transporter outer membrane subunit [Steroidobacteraceae bacterium]|nr:efflux transporter outer membrane subunit [Steroidobacteraceae bacterium]